MDSARELRAHGSLALRHSLQVVADTNDLRHIIHLSAEVRNNRGRKFYCPFLAIDMWPMTLADEPIDPAIDPNIEVVRFDYRDHRFHDVVLKHTLFDQAEIWPNEKSTVKRSDWRRECEWFDKHLHAARRPAARDSESDGVVSHFLHCGFCALGQHLIVRDECPIDISKKKFNRHELAQTGRSRF